MSILQGRATGSVQRLDEDQVRAGLRLLADPEAGVYIQGFPAARGASFPGRDIDSMVSWCRVLADCSRLQVALNPCAPGRNTAPKADEFLRRRWLMVSVDAALEPEAVAQHGNELMASEGELRRAWQLAVEVCGYLSERDWPDAAVIDSGNGYHVLYRVDLPNDPATKATLTRLMKVLRQRFNGERGAIEASASANLATRVPGSWRRKGRNLPARPHRMGKLVDVPDPVEVVGIESILAVAGNEPPRATPPAPNPLRGRAPSDDTARAYLDRAINGEAYKVLTTPPSAGQGQPGRNTQLNTSAFALGQFVGAGLLTEEEVIAALLPAARGCGLPERDSLSTIHSGLRAGRLEPRGIPESRNGTAPTPAQVAAAVGGVTLYRMTDLLALQLAEPNWAVPGLLCEGLNILAGKPKLGKSWMALNLGITIAMGGMALGTSRTTAGDVLYLSLEDRLRRVQGRARKILSGIQGQTGLEKLQVAVEWPRQDAGGLEAVAKWAQEAQNPRLAIVDVWAKFRPQSRAGRSAYDQDYEHASALKSVADKHAFSLLVLHHCKKAPADDALDEISGTLGFAGSADGTLILTRARNENEAALFVTGRDVEDKKLALLFDPAHAIWTCQGDADAIRGGKQEQKVIEVLSTSDRWLYPREVGDIANMDRNTASAVLSRLFHAGRIRRDGSKYGPPLREEVAF
jgi:hypothetical protein